MGKGKDAGSPSLSSYPIWHVASPSRPPQIVLYRSNTALRFYIQIYESAGRGNTLHQQWQFRVVDGTSPHRHVDHSGYSSAQLDAGPARQTQTTKGPARRPLALGSRRVLAHGHLSNLRVFYMYTLPRIYVHRHTSQMRAELHFRSVPTLASISQSLRLIS
jgi:hypothetical protein